MQTDQRQQGMRTDQRGEGMQTDEREQGMRTGQREPGMQTDQREHPAGLLVCADCGSPLVYPADCEQQGRDRWYVELSCPECGATRTRLFDLDTLDELDTELDRAEAQIRADLRRLTNANMLDYVTRFVSALNAGAIEPIDFAA